MNEIFYKECKIEDINTKDKTLVVIASDETVDRKNEIMMANGCQYGDYIPLLWAHNRAEILPPIGRIMSVNKRNNRVKIKVQFAKTEFAVSIYNLYISEPPMLEKFSVGFITKKERKPTDEEVKKGIIRIVVEWELLEVSAVPIPANPNASVDREMRTRIKDAIDNGEIRLPEMVYKDFGFEELKEVGSKEEVKVGIKEEEEDLLKEFEEIGEENSRELEKMIKKNWNVIVGEEEIKKSELKGKLDALKEIEENPLAPEEVTAIENIEEKPFTNFHSCDISDKKYPKYRIAKCERKHKGKCIDVNYGILSPDKSEISSLRYSIDIWTEVSAKAHCKGEKGKFIAATKEAKAEKYKCECIKCGHKLESEKHCKDIKCPKCGGEMRRVGHPGPGKEIDISHTLEDYKLIYNKETKEYHFKLKEEEDNIDIVEPTITFEDNPQEEEKTELEKSEESEDVKKLAKELAKDFIDSFLRDFRRDYLGKVDDD